MKLSAMCSRSRTVSVRAMNTSQMLLNSVRMSPHIGGSRNTYRMNTV